MKTTHKPTGGHDATFITFGSDDGGYEQWQADAQAFLSQGGLNIVNDLDALIKGGATLAPVTSITQAPSAGNVGQMKDPYPQPAPQQSAWSQPPAQQGGHSGLHPAGETCPLDGKTLVADTTKTGKKQWKCPDYRYSNGQANGHRVEWV